MTDIFPYLAENLIIDYNKTVVNLLDHRRSHHKFIYFASTFEFEIEYVKNKSNISPYLSHRSKYNGSDRTFLTDTLNATN